jgi:hypothetical protein
MTVEEIKELFAKYESSYGDDAPKYEDIKPERILNKEHDVHAMILLTQLSNGRVIGGADHDIIYLSHINDIAENATEEDILDLIRLGIFNSSEYECLCMFV